VLLHRKRQKTEFIPSLQTFVRFTNCTSLVTNLAKRATYRKTSNKRPQRLIDAASISTLALSPLRLLMSFVPMFPVYDNFTLHMSIITV